MFDRRSYLDTISALRADPDKLEEIIKMKENDRRHIPHSLRPVAAVAAALALLGISVGAVNTEPVQEFLYHISTAVQVLSLIHIYPGTFSLSGGRRPSSQSTILALG